MIGPDDPRDDHPLDGYLDYDPYYEMDLVRAQHEEMDRRYEDDMIADAEEEAREREARDAEIARKGEHMGKTNLGQVMRELLQKQNLRL